MIGKTVSHYKILEKLGSGGMGVVYKAEDTKLKRTVALKFLPPNLTCDPEAKTRFIHEAQAASGLEHPNICNIHEINETNDGQTYIVMACYEGKTLKQLIQDGSLNVNVSIQIITQIAQGLSKAHKKGIIHRDIKPANVIIDEDGSAKILDFGLAKLSGQTMLTKTGTTIGTINYMSPEQARGESIDQRTDIWSLGVLSYEMLTNQLPFRSEYDQAVIYSIINEELLSPSILNEDISQELEHIVQKCLSKNPNERYQNIDNFLEDLQLIKIQAGPHKIKKDSIARKTNRKKILYLLTGIVLAIVVIFLIKIEYFSIYQTDEINSIAVLPFENFSNDTEQEYFTDGMTDALITELSKISALRVISRTSVMQYKKVNKSLSDIAEELDVDAVVEGSVLRAGDKVRITAKLIKTKPEKLLWAGDDERNLRDVITLQKEVAKAITNEIEITLTPVEEANLASIKTVNPEAYELYLQGRFLMHNYGTPESIQKSINYFLKAVEKDASYAQAYAGLADAYTVLGNYAMLPPNEVLPKAKRYAIKALEIDETLAEVHTALGYIRMTYDWDWTGAELSLKRAIMLNPGCSYAYEIYSWYKAVRGRFDEAIVIAKQAIDLNPLSKINKSLLGERLYFAGRYDDAITQLKKVLDADPNYYYAHWNLGWVYEQKKMYGKAITEFQKSVDYSAGLTSCIASLGHGYAISGKKNEANRVLKELKELSKSQYVSSYDIAVIHTGLGEIDKAIIWLEKAFEQRDGYLGGFINIDPRLNILKSDKRFVELIKTIGYKN